MKPEAFFVVSQWNNDVSWIEEYTDDYIIYDKSNTLPEGPKVIKFENVGHNLHDIFHYCYSNYNNLPNLVAFLEGHPFDHCNKQKLDRIIHNKFFTCLESYENAADHRTAMKDATAGWTEENNNGMIISHPRNYASIFQTYNQALDNVFKNPYYPQYIKFAPGGMYIVEKERILHYSKEWWRKLLEMLSKDVNQAEAYIFERMLWTIFSCAFEEKL